MKNPFTTADQLITGDGYTSSEAMDNLTILCDEFGSRFGGTEGEKRAAEFMVEKLRAYGLSNVHLEEIPYTGWVRGEVTLEILSPIQMKMDCITLPHSPAADIEATLIDVGEGAPADFEKHAAELAGKIVMANSVTFPQGMKRWVHRGEKFNRSILNGAAGFIFVNHYPAYGPATGGVGHKGEEALIPAISVCYEDGAFLSRLIKKHGEVKVRITSTDRCEPMVSWNIIADLPGKTDPDTIVMLGSHYDGHDISQGAQDPASGAAAVMEAARLLAKHTADLPCTVRFALWGIEEIGLLGSRRYVQDHLDELKHIRFYFNMDGAGAAPNKGVVFNEWAALEKMAAAWRKEMALDFGIEQSISAFSDHYPFLQKGVPTGGLQSVPRGTGGRGYGHTRYDTLDKVTVRELQDAAVMAARLALRWASVDDWPVPHRTLQEVAELLDSPAYKETSAFAEEVAAFYAKARSE